MLPRSTAPTGSVSASTVAPVGLRNYHLPGDDEETAWLDLLLPFAGRLRLPHTSSRKKKAVCQCFRGPVAKPKPAVDVWLQCGLHFCTVPDGDVAPVPGRPFPTAAGDGRVWDFLPLRRDAPDGTRFFDVRVKPAWGDGTGAAAAVRKGVRAESGWVVEVSSPQSPPAFDPVTFVAENKGDAAEWERQLVMRAAPLSVVWQRALGRPTVGGSSAAGPSTRPWVGGARALSDAVNKLVGTGAPAALTGIVTAVMCDEIFNAVTSAGSCAAFVGGALATVVRVCAAAVTMRDFAEDLRCEAQSLSDVLGSHLLPAVISLDDAGSANAAILRNKVAVVAACLDVLVGRLLHLSVSKSAGLREAAIAGGRIEALSPVKEVEACRAAVAALQTTTALDVGTHHMKLTTDAARVAHDEYIEDAQALVAVPTMTDRIVAEWGDAHAAQPWCRLLKMVMREPPQSAAAMSACVVGALGMGGVGKTTVCKLVAQQVAKDNAGRQRYDNVYWVQLSQEVIEAKVIQYMVALATVECQKKVTAPSIPVAVDRLQCALAGKAVLVVVDDCWHDGLVEHFRSAVQHPQCGRCCLLFTTRLERIARRVAAADRVMQINPMEPAAGKDMLLAYARGTGSSASQPGGEDEDLALPELLKAAAGLPLALAVLGSLVRAEGWVKAAKLLRFALAQGACPESIQYPTLWACFGASSRELDAKGDLYVCLLNALCVVEKQELLPLSALSALWGTSDEDTDVHARHLADLALVTVRPATDGGDGLVLGLHDLVIDWVRGYRVSPPEQRQPYHQALLERYGSRLTGESPPLPSTGRSVGCRPWWLLSADGYIGQTLCRHLRAAGPALWRELVALLCDMRWIEVRVGHSGDTAVAYRADCRVSGVALLERVATILEGALGAAARLRIPAMQLMAFEVIARLQGASLAGGTERDVVEWLVQSARQYRRRPSITLLASSRLSLHQEVSILYGHPCEVTCSCVVRQSTGRNLVVSGSDDGTLRVWDADRGECVAVLNGHSCSVSCVCVVEVGGGGDGVDCGCKVQRVVSGSDDHTLRVWDADRGECVAVLKGHSDKVMCVCVVEVGGGGDGGGSGGKVQRVVSGSADHMLRVWDAGRGECVAVLEGHSHWVRCVCVVEVGGGGVGGGGGGKAQRVVSGSRDRTLRVWDAGHGECVAVLKGHRDTVTCVCVVEVGVGGDGGGGGGKVQRVVSGSADHTLRVWDAGHGECVAVMKGHSHWVTCVCVVEVDVGGDGGGGGGMVQRVVSGSAHHTLRVWDAGHGECVAELKGHSDLVRCVGVVEVSGGGDGGVGGGKVQRVVSGSRDRTLRVWDADRGECVAVLKGHSDKVMCVCVVEVGGGGDGGGSGGKVQRVVSGSADHTLRVWDAGRGECVGENLGNSGWVTCVCVVEVGGGGDGGGGGGKVQRVVSGSDDHTLRVWDADRGECLAVLKGHRDTVTCVCVAEVGGVGDGGGGGGKVQRVVSGSADHTLRVWDAGRGECVGEHLGHSGWVTCVCVVEVGGGGDMQRVVSGSADRTLRVWDAGRGECVAVMKGHSRSVTCVCVVEVGVGGDGGGGGGKVQRVVSGSADHMLRVWDAGHGECVAVLKGHRDTVTCVCVVEVGGGGDGGGGGGKVQRVVSGSADHMLRVWDADRGECVAVLKGHSSPVTCVCVVEVGGGGDGGGGGGKVQRVVSGSADHTLRVWEASADGTFMKGPVWSLPARIEELSVLPARVGSLLCVCSPVVVLVDTLVGECSPLAFPFGVRTARAYAPGRVVFGGAQRVDFAHLHLV
ncbi:hypothetical protein BU14_0093s0020 [Porphyra umbilicalis]|uniref:NB-ARC domain-containing protein n=1 Tax=Porphyra umbilicalis TaxID=2786 RepID=A0A1X6PDK9_PORUM|nr:hypothetical protein BU14_0093s0020 [Porphyra umbilicalis]|eukprot:OSX78977.1 hypothetical protein BU14_0093s0020 [Porphyra umbilicalis]